jgi:hypothetical protein
MLSKLWVALAGIAGAVLAIFMAFKKGGDSRANKIKAKLEEKARKTEKASAKAMVDGLEKEEGARNAAVDTDKRDHFS